MRIPAMPLLPDLARHVAQAVQRVAGGWDAGRGAAGESRAARWLTDMRGFRIVARNWRNPRDRREEIDLVAWDGPALVFVEVKTRAAGALVPGYHAVDRRKKRVLLRAARAYLIRLPERPGTIRLDVVEVDAPGGSDSAVRHFEHVPLFPRHFRG